MNVVHLPCNDDDHGKQRCRLGPIFMSDNDIAPNGSVRIISMSNAFICRAWPRQDLCEGYIEYDEVISDYSVVLNERKIDVVKLQDHDGTSVIRLCIVLSDTEKVFRFKSSQSQLLKYAKHE